MAVVQTKKLCFKYKRQSQPALNGIDCSVEQGECVALIGHTGAGKSTFLQCLSGIIPKFYSGDLSGEIIVFDGMSDSKNAGVRTRIGHLFQDFEAQLFSSTVALEVAFPLENRGVPRSEMHDIVERSLGQVNLAEFHQRNPHELSGGQKQRVSIASILGMSPDLLLLDEPTTDLDPVGKRDVVQVLQVLKNEGKTILLVDQETDGLLDVDRICVFWQGQMIAEGRPREVLSNIELLAKAGVKPPELLELCARKGITPGGSSLADVHQTIREHGFTINQQKKEQIVAISTETANQLDPLLEVSHVSFAYSQAEPVLKDISLSFCPAEFVAILGANGSGKTTLVKQMNKLLQPSSGSVTFHGLDVSNQPQSTIGKKIGFVFQNPDHMIFSATVSDEIAFGPRNYGFSASEIEQSVKNALELVHLTGREKDDPFSLTKGDRQKVAVASVLACRPEIVILDEPTTGLDYPEQIKMMALLKTLVRSGHTVIFITHSVWLAAAYSSRIILMEKGRVIADGPPRKVLFDFETLARTSLEPTPIIRFAAQSGVPLLTVDELDRCLTNNMSGENT